HIELLGSDLGERRHDALPEFDLAGEHRDAAVGIDAQPGIQRAVGLQAAREPRRVLPEPDFWHEAEREDDATDGGDEVAARQARSVHGQTFPFCCAARRTARMIRLWVPQRQRLLTSAARTSASRGCGLRLSRSAAAMIMPLMQ